MRQISDELWETEAEFPFPGLTTHAYLWTGGKSGNMLFYSVTSDANFSPIDKLGGISHQYLSHRDEAGPALALIAQRYGAQLHAPAAEHADIAKHSAVHVPLDAAHIDANGVQVIPTPGHTPGSTCFQLTGADGQKYLFVGDTMFRGESGHWAAGYIEGMSDAATLTKSLDVLAQFKPDVVIASAAPSGHGVLRLGERPWSDYIEQAASGLRADSLG